MVWGRLRPKGYWVAYTFLKNWCSWDMIFHFDMTREASWWLTWRSSLDACGRLDMSAVWFCNDAQVPVVRGVPIQSQSGVSPCFCKHEIVNFFHWESIAPRWAAKIFIYLLLKGNRNSTEPESKTPRPMFTKYLNGGYWHRRQRQQRLS